MRKLMESLRLLLAKMRRLVTRQREVPKKRQVLFTRHTKAVGHVGRKSMPTYEFMCESCKKSFEVALTVAERAAANVQCPTCGRGEVTPQMAIFTAKTSRK